MLERGKIKGYESPRFTAEAAAIIVWLLNKFAGKVLLTSDGLASVFGSNVTKTDTLTSSVDDLRKVVKC